ncbi:MAG: glycerol-3-phosphate acyltransferase [Clostridia bacterium]
MDWKDIVIKVVACLAAYFVGSVNFAKLFARLKHTDITSVGSGNPGTMNMLRSVGKFWGAMTFICDAIKGIVFALIGRFCLSGGEFSVTPNGYDWLFILGIITIVGHVFPIYSKFRGGKGVATSIGVFLVAFPIVSSVALVCLIIFMFKGKYGFIGSLVTIGVLSIFSSIMCRDSVAVIVVALCMFCVVLFTHRGNIKRALSGKENTLSLTKKQKVQQEEMLESSQGEKQNDTNATEKVAKTAENDTQCDKKVADNVANIPKKVAKNATQCEQKVADNITKNATNDTNATKNVAKTAENDTKQSQNDKEIIDKKQ